MTNIIQFIKLKLIKSIVLCVYNIYNNNNNNNNVNTSTVMNTNELTCKIKSYDEEVL